MTVQDGSNPLLAAVRARLLADPGVAAIVDDRVFDEPLQTVGFPWLQIGETQALRFGRFKGGSIYLTLHAWARGDWAGDTARDLASACVASLEEQKFPVAGYNIQLIEHQSTDVLRDPDGLTRHGVVSFRLDITAA